MKAIRTVVSGSRVRYTEAGYDLDLTYITPRLIAMGYPACGMEKTYRNDIAEVADFLNARHPNTYRVFNLSERKYDYSRFQHRVSECGFPDHHPPPLQVLVDIINDMLQWTARDERNVIVVHCLAGKGRTGVVCSCYLLLTGLYGDIFRVTSDRELRELVNFAIKDFWDARGQGVRYPSQALYIYYFARVVRRLRRMPKEIPRLRPARKLMLRTIVLHGIPEYEAPPRGGCTPFLQVLPAPSQHDKPPLLYNSSWQNPKFDTYAADPEGSIIFQPNCIIQGDVLVRGFHANSYSILGKHVVQMFHVNFNTDFFHKSCEVYRLPKKDVDEAHDNGRFPSAFHLDFHVEPIVDDDDDDEFILNERQQQNIDRSSTATTVRTEMVPRRSSGTAQRLMSSQATPMMGWLYKQGGFVKNWKKRWFVAREGKLTYYSNASDPTPLGVVDLRGVHVDVCHADETTARNRFLNYFKIVPARQDQRTWYFGADSESEMTKWIRSVAAQSCYGAGGYPQQPMSAPSDRRSSDFAGVPLQRNNTFNGHRNSDTRAIEIQRQRPPSAGTIDFGASSTSNAAMRGSVGPVGYHRSLPNDRVVRSDQIAQVQDPDAMMNKIRNSSLASMDDDRDEHFLLTGNLASYIQSRPVDTALHFSDLDRMTMLQEVGDDVPVGSYIYTADELQTAAKMQKYLTTTKMEDVNGQQIAIIHRLRRAIRTGEMEYAEQLLAEVVVTKFSGLIDAMEANPSNFIDMIIGSAIDSKGASRIEGVEF